MRFIVFILLPFLVSASEWEGPFIGEGAPYIQCSAGTSIEIYPEEQGELKEILSTPHATVTMGNMSDATEQEELFCAFVASHALLIELKSIIGYALNNFGAFILIGDNKVFARHLLFSEKFNKKDETAGDLYNVALLLFEYPVTSKVFPLFSGAVAGTPQEFDLYASGGVSKKVKARRTPLIMGECRVYSCYLTELGDPTPCAGRFLCKDKHLVSFSTRSVGSYGQSGHDSMYIRTFIRNFIQSGYWYQLLDELRIMAQLDQDFGVSDDRKQLNRSFGSLSTIHDPQTPEKSVNHHVRSLVAPSDMSPLTPMTVRGAGVSDFWDDITVCGGPEDNILSFEDNILNFSDTVAPRLQQQTGAGAGVGAGQPIGESSPSNDITEGDEDASTASSQGSATSQHAGGVEPPSNGGGMPSSSAEGSPRQLKRRNSMPGRIGGTHYGAFGSAKAPYKKGIKAPRRKARQAVFSFGGGVKWR